MPAPDYDVALLAEMACGLETVPPDQFRDYRLVFEWVRAWMEQVEALMDQHAPCL